MVGRILVLVLTLLSAVGAVQAQPAGQARRVGMLLYDGAPPGFLEAFRDELRALGHLEGNNLTIEMRNAAGRNERLGALADELVRLKVDVILAMNTPAAQAARKATTTIPIVMARAGDPVRSGLVSSLAHPGERDRPELQQRRPGPQENPAAPEILPGMSRIAVLSNVDNPGHTPQIPAMERACSDLGLKLQSLRVHGSGDFLGRVSGRGPGSSQALFVLDDTTFTRHRGEILKLARTHGMPVVSRYKDFAEAGGLIAYGPSLPCPVPAHLALRGPDPQRGEPSDLPIEEPTEFDLVVNLRTARALGLNIPPSVLLITTHVID